MNSNDLKCSALAWLRYKRQCTYACSEVGYFSADVWGIDDNRLIEIETKISIADLRADFKKPKHKLYAKSAEEFEIKSSVTASMPNIFYFCIPEELVEKAEAYLVGKAEELPLVSRYGILVYKEWNSLFGDNVVMHRKAAKLHTAKPSPRTKEIAATRMSSEICGLHRTIIEHHLSYEGERKYLRDTIKRLYDHERQQQVPALEEDDAQVSETPV